MGIDRSSEIQVCQRCGEDFRYHRKKAYCSKKCRKSPIRVYEHECDHCGRMFHSKRSETKYCSRKCLRVSRRFTTGWCRSCGSMFKATFDRKKYCSRECARLPVIPKAEREQPQRIVHCKRCGLQFYGKLRNREVCDDCINQCSVEEARQCRCGIVFLTHQNAKMCLVCRARERKSISVEAKVKRRQRTRGGRIDVIEVFEMADWKCQECGCEVTRSGEPCEDNYATLDHVVPLSKGGLHENGNAQCLCRMCNMIKSDTIPDTGGG